ncbi:phage head closure protein [Enterobacter quasiroggenkampii]|uniref:phage head closure protein n=1 Tax=Enterobacter quasiroggenkampii TaxID=2497436 RepID=UPI001F455226|nr:phage head closure protein [Enterobacter quasiroggenkampii]
MKRTLTEQRHTYREPEDGELNCRVEFRRRQDVPEPGGGTHPMYTDMFKTWGKFRQVSGSAYLQSMQVQETITHTITIRYRKITSDMEAVIDGSIYRVVRAGELSGQNEQKTFAYIELKELGAETPDDPPPGESTFYGGYGYGNAR